jgi:hypothetical protein
MITSSLKRGAVLAAAIFALGAATSFAGDIVPSESPYAVSKPKTQTKQLPAQATTPQPVSPCQADATAGVVSTDADSSQGQHCHS